MLMCFQASHGQHFTGDATKASALQEMMRLVSLHDGAIIFWGICFVIPT